MSVYGDWHLWIEFAEWKVATTNFTLDHRARRAVKREECLQELDGQRLLTVASGIDGSLLMKFDLGGTLEVLPWTKGSDGYQWGLYAWSGEIVVCRLDGSLEFEKRSNPAS